MPVEAEPTVEYIKSLDTHLSSLWRGAHQEWRVDDTFYNRSYSLWDPGLDRPVHHPSKPTEIIDHAVDNQLAYDPKVHRWTTKKGELHEIRADTVEAWMVQVFEESSLLEPSLTWKQVGKHLLLYGYTVVEGPLLDMMDKGEAGWFPIRMKAPHPSQILMDPMEKQPSQAIKKANFFAKDLEALTEKKKGRRRQVKVWEAGNQPFKEVPVIEYWSKGWHGLVAGGSLLYTERNTWGFVPFVHAYAGFGQIPTSSSRLEPRDMAVGLLRPIRESLKMMAQARSGRHNALINATFAPMGTTGDAGEVSDQLARGDILEGMQEGDLWWMRFPNLPRWIFQSEDMVERDIEAGTYARSLSGTRQQGVSTVGQQAILSTAAAKKFVAPAKQMEQMASIVGSNILRLVDKLDEKLMVRGFSVGPEEIDGDYNCRVTFELIDPVLQLQQRELGMREVQAGLKSIETYWSADARLEDVSGERRRILEDLVRKDPAYVSEMAKVVAAGLGMPDVMEAMQNGREQAQVQAQGLLQGLEPTAGPMGAPSALPPEEGSPRAAGAAMRQLRQPLTPSVASPGRSVPHGL